MSGAIEEIAAQAVAAALAETGPRPAACCALMRLAGEALARLTSHDEACRAHAGLARRHAVSATRGRA